MKGSQAWPIKANSQAVKLARSVHIYTAVLMLFVLCFFSITGITLNHANWVGEPVITKLDTQLKSQGGLIDADDARLLATIQTDLQLRFPAPELERDDEVVVIDSQGAGEQWQLEIDLATGEVTGTHINYGWMAKLNDWHKGRHTPEIWNVFLDVMAIVIVLFCLSGLWLLLPNKKKLIPVTLWGVGGTIVWFLLLLF